MVLLDSLDTGFDAAFMAPCPPTAAFDYLYRVTLPTQLDASLAVSDAPAWRFPPPSPSPVRPPPRLQPRSTAQCI